MTRKLVGLIAIVSDTHVGGTTSLMPPRTLTTEDGQETKQSRWQGWLWECWEDYCQQVKGAHVPTFVLVNGDVTEGKHHDTPQLLIDDEAMHSDLAIEVLEPLLQHASGCAFVIGTGAHVGKMGRLERPVAKHFLNRGLIPAENNQPIHFEFKREIQLGTGTGVLINAAHHTRGGIDDKGRLNAQMLNVQRHITDSTRDCVPYAHYLIRSHIHHFVDTQSYYATRALVCGCWQLPTEFAHKIAPDKLPHIGGWFIEIYDNGTSDARQMRYEVLKSDRSYPVVKPGEA